MYLSIHQCLVIKNVNSFFIGCYSTIHNCTFSFICKLIYIVISFICIIFCDYILNQSSCFFVSFLSLCIIIILLAMPYAITIQSTFIFNTLNHEQDEHTVESLLTQSILSYNPEIQFHCNPTKLNLIRIRVIMKNHSYFGPN